MKSGGANVWEDGNISINSNVLQFVIKLRQQITIQPHITANIQNNGKGIRF